MASDERYLALKVVMMPRDTNQHGTIFGGVTLSYLDQAGAMGASHAVRQTAGWPLSPMVLVGMASVAFHEPVYVGDVLSFWTQVLRSVGRTSITMHVVVEADRDGQTVRLTEAEVTYVTVESSGGTRHPVPIRGD